MVRVGLRIGAVDVDLDRLERARLDEAADDGVGHTGERREFADQALSIADPLERLFALRGEAGRGLSGGAIFDDEARPLQRAGRGERHAQDRCGRGEVIGRGPFDQAAQRGAQRGYVGDGEQRAQAVVADLRVRRQVFGLPRDAEQLARAERGDDDRAGLDVHAVGDAIVERAEGGIEDEDAGAGHRGGIWRVGESSSPRA